MSGPKTPEEALDLLLENLNAMSHCCECERGIYHFVCIQFCKATSEQNCIYQWYGKENIVGYISEDKEIAYYKPMTFKEWQEWIQTNKIIKLGELGLASP